MQSGEALRTEYMVIARPFRGATYNEQVAGPLGMNLCPPFDAIDADLETDLLRRSPYNIVRLERMRRRNALNAYLKTAQTQTEWIRKGVLERRKESCLYVVEESFAHGGGMVERKGVVAAIRLEPYESGVVLPHERTRRKWVEDRIRLMETAQANYSPLLATFQDKDGGILTLLDEIASAEPFAVAQPPDMQSLRIWRIEDKNEISKVSAALADKQIVIADGHHRYEAALRYRNLLSHGRRMEEDMSANHRMMLLVSATGTGLVTRGYHRIIQGAPPEVLEKLENALAKSAVFTEWVPTEETLSAVAESFMTKLGEYGKTEVLFGVCTGSPPRFRIAKLNDLQTNDDEGSISDYGALHRVVFGNTLPPGREEDIVGFHYDLPQVLTSLKNRDIQMVFVMRPLPMETFTEITTQSKILPPKVTNFYPKPPAGFVIQTLHGAL